MKAETVIRRELAGTGRHADGLAKQITEALEKSGHLLDGKRPVVIGAGDFAKLLGTTSSNLRTFVGLPEPIERTSSGPVYLGSQAREFAREHSRRRRR